MRSLDVGQRYGELKDKRRWISPQLRLKQGLASKLVFRSGGKVLAGVCDAFVSGAARYRRAFVFVSRGGHSDPSGIRRDGDVHRLGESTGE